MMWLSTPQVIGLTKLSGGGGVNDELIFRSCETKDVGSFGIQLPITIRPPGFVTLTNSLPTSKGLGANMAPKTESQIKGVVADPFQVARISFLEFQSVEIRFRSPLISRVDEVLRNVDSHDFGPETGER